MNTQKTFLCITCEFKGVAFLKTIKEQGHKVYLVTSEKTRGKNWPVDSIEEIFYIPGDDGRTWDMNELIAGTKFLFSQHVIDRIIALDDYEVWKAATLREEFRIDGMGVTTARHFFDKLAMRMQAKSAGIKIPQFTNLFNDGTVAQFLEDSTGPWIVKPRMDAGSLGIRKIPGKEECWQWLRENDDKRHMYLLEEFKPGQVYHVDALYENYKSLFTRSSVYLQTPFEVAHGGGVFCSQTLDAKEAESKELEILNDKLLKAFGLNFGASHSEFIKCNEDGEFYFLETSARVGGAHLADMVHAATDINLWREWALLEISKLVDGKYKMPKVATNNAGIVVTLSRVKNPDYSVFNDSDIWWSLYRDYHIGLILKNKSKAKITEKLIDYRKHFVENYSTSVPLKE
jgi:hypothetical protein